MADSDEPSPDEMFELLYEIVPQVYRGELVEGRITMSPKSGARSAIIEDVRGQMLERFGRKGNRFPMDVGLDLPGGGNVFCPDLFKPAAGAKPDKKGKWRYQDVEFVLEVVSRGTARNDYGVKKDTYAVAEIAVYVIADPYTGKCHVYTLPKDGEYHGYSTIDFGEPIDLTDTVLGMTLETDEFPRE
ncbi:Uma2 family endonuclease [Streptomyces gamaensis]|uniref:Uma2 family endonuclease n=1 Tax=Streptomyces gamaensis TaxID=1763542 RepID=A0ABW0YXR8_9ACTN